MTNADPVTLELQYDAATKRLMRIVAKIREVAVYMPNEIQDADDPPRWRRVVRRWQAKHR